MKKEFKIGIIAFLLLIVVGGIALISINYKKPDKGFEKATELIGKKEYDKAVLALDMALDEDKNNKKAIELKDILEKYLDSKKDLDKGDFKKASETLDSINKEYYDYNLLKDDISNLKEEIDSNLKSKDDIKKELDALRDKIKENNLKDAKNLLKSLEESNLDENQKKELGDLKSILDIKEEKEKDKENSSKEAEQKKSANRKSSSNSTRAIYLKKLADVERCAKGEEGLIATGVTSDMVTGLINQYTYWDDALNDIYGQLKTQLSESQMKELQRKQVAWIKYKEKTAKEKSDDHGSSSSIIYNDILVQLTRERCYYLVNNYMN